MIRKEWSLQEVKLYLLMPEVFNEFWEVFQHSLTRPVEIVKRDNESHMVRIIGKPEAVHKCSCAFP